MARSHQRPGLVAARASDVNDFTGSGADCHAHVATTAIFAPSHPDPASPIDIKDVIHAGSARDTSYLSGSNLAVIFVAAVIAIIAIAAPTRRDNTNAALIDDDALGVNSRRKSKGCGGNGNGGEQNANVHSGSPVSSIGSPNRQHARGTRASRMRFRSSYAASNGAALSKATTPTPSHGLSNGRGMSPLEVALSSKEER
jgi:hypothetical protein